MKKRIITFSVLMFFLFSVIGGRIGFIIFSNNYTVSKSYNSYALTLETLYPDICYDDNSKITNNKEKYIAVLKPNEKTLSDLHNLFSSSEVYNISNQLSEGYPILKEIDNDKENNAKYIDIISVNSSDYIAKQLISADSSGLLNYVEPYGERKISFHIDALGRMLSGDKGDIYEEQNNNLRSIKLTLNKKIEEIAYNASKNIKSGCVVVMDVNSSSILACISKPDNSYINKPFEKYNVGSVFKIIVALCALENNIDFYYTCEGKTKLGDTEFSCQKNHIHGFENLKSALANSCNCYFINLALKLGKDKLFETAEKLGFNDDIKLYNDWSIKSASMPTENELNSKGELALLGFGQGKLVSTPLQMCYSLCTIANNGKKNNIKLVTSENDGQGNKKEIEYQPQRTVFKEDNCNKLIEYLRYVVTNGTGKNAQDGSKKSAGKTATAQTGQYFLGKELLNTWFAGVYPCDNPKYAIVVMCENGRSGSEDCAPIFRQIVEKLKVL